MEKKFGELLQELRKEKGWTQQQLADLLNVSNKSVSKWERNEGYPETGTLLEISKLFDIRVDDLLKGRKDIDLEEIERKTVNQQEILQQWQIHRASLLSALTLVFGMMLFYGVYFLTQRFVPSFFLFACFMIVSVSFLIFKREKIKVFTGKKVNEELFEWVSTVSGMLVLLVPCINFPMTISLLKKLGVSINRDISQLIYFIGEEQIFYTHLNFQNYLTWLPFLIPIAVCVKFLFSSISQKKVLHSFKLSFLMMVLVIGVSWSAVCVENSIRPSVKMEETEYRDFKLNYKVIAQGFDVLPDNMYDIDSSKLNSCIEGKKRYTKYMNVAGFDDDSQKVYYELSDDAQKMWKTGRLLLSWVLSVTGLIIIIKRKEAI